MSTMIRHDGYIVDTETGEVISGHVDLPAHEPFVVDAPEKAEWVLGKLQNEHALLAAVAAKRAAINENLAAEERAIMQRANWLGMRFGADLEAFAKAELAGAKSKTWKCAFGSLSFRATAEKIEIEDAALALDWCRVNCPDAVKVTESVLKTPLADLKDQLPLGAFSITPATETFKIDTGVKI